jgi:hypothetical protein
MFDFKLEEIGDSRNLLFQSNIIKFNNLMADN